MSTYVPIASQTLSTTPTAVTFENLPQAYTDLVLVINGSNASSAVNLTLTFNNDSNSVYSSVRFFGYSAGTDSSMYTSQTNMKIGINESSSTAYTQHRINIQNYSNTTRAKNVVARSSAASTYLDTYTGTYNSTNPITTITIEASGASFRTGSTFTLFGIESGTVKAVGGEVTVTGGYAYHTFRGSGTFTPIENLTADILVVAGGGGADNARAGGGGAGGLVGFTSQSLTPQTYAVTVGAGGTTRGSQDSVYPTNGTNSRFGSLTAAVGGGAGGIYADAAYNGSNGGSGGGGTVGFFIAQGLGGSPTSGQGNAGGNSVNKTAQNGGWTAGGGGGGAGAAGTSASGNGVANNTQTPGNGGDGVSTYSSWGIATNTGQDISGTRWFAGGGASIGINSSGANIYSNTGNGNGGNYNTAPQTSTGGGGSAGSAGTGASGIVIVRYAI